MVNNKIYGFVGVLGGGKSYQAQQLINKGFQKISFADKLREMAWRMLDWEPSSPEAYDMFKKGELDIGYGKLDGRLVLQKLGQMMREIDPDFWVKQCKRKIDLLIQNNKDINICFDDVRYINEIKMLLSYQNKADVKITFCNYISDRYDCRNNHESELLAQQLLKLGYNDGDLLQDDIFDKLNEL